MQQLQQQTNLINVWLNDKPVTITAGRNLINLLQQHKYTDYTSFAVAINMTFISKEKYSTYIIQTGDKIEVVAPMQGG